MYLTNHILSIPGHRQVNMVENGEEFVSSKKRKFFSVASKTNNLEK